MNTQGRLRTRQITFQPPAPDTGSASGAAAFTREMREAVAGYFAERGLSPFADAGMVLKSVAMLALVFGPYALILSGAVPAAAMLGLTVAMGIGVAGTGFCVVHDSLHGSYSRSRRWNRRLGVSIEILGGSGYFWHLTHNVIHHTYTNIIGVDEDLDAVQPLIRLTPATPWHWYHRFQHWYAWPLYSLATLNWVFLKDYKSLAAKRLGPFDRVRVPRRELWRLLGFKATHHLWTLAVPILLGLPWTHVLLGYVVMSLTAGLIMGVVFQLGHVTEGTVCTLPPATGRIPEEWLVHQMRTTSNFAVRSRVLAGFLGGLDHQIEHHAFPHVCSVHYRALAPIVESVCARHGVPYNRQPSFLAAIASHYRRLKRLALAPGHGPAAR